MIRAFLDASVLFAAAYSNTGAAHEIVQLGIRGHVDLWVSAYVLEEARRNLTRKAPEALPAFENLLQAADFSEASPTLTHVRAAADYTELKDAPVVAAALRARAKYLTTHDTKHLVGNATVATTSGLLIVSPRDLLKAIRDDTSKQRV